MCINYKSGLVRATGLEIQVPFPEGQRKAWLEQEQELAAGVGAVTEGISAMTSTLRVVRGSAQEPHMREPHQYEQGCGVALRSGLALETWAVYPTENKSEGAEGCCLWSGTRQLRGPRSMDLDGVLWREFLGNTSLDLSWAFSLIPILGLFTHEEHRSHAPVPGAGCWGL